MRSQFPSLSIMIFKIRWYLRSPASWVIIGILVIAITTAILEPRYLSYSNTIIFILIPPIAGGLAIGPSFAWFYFLAHSSINGKIPINKKTTFRYSFSANHVQTKPGLLEPTVYTMLNLFGLIYLVISATQLFDPNLANFNSRVLLAVLLMLPSAMVSSGFNVSVLIYKATGFMFENEKEGDREDLGKNLRKNLGKVIGVGAIIALGAMLSTSPGGVGTTLAIFMGILVFTFLPAYFGFYIIRSKYLEKMKNNFIMKVENRDMRTTS